MRKYQTNTFVITLLLWALAIDATGQATDGFTFDHLTVEEGLSQSSVFAITKDAEGFMWFGTRDGLNRYDSRSIKVYRNKENNERSLSGNSINCLIVDSQKKLWIGTNEGLNIYDAETDDFIRGELDTDFEPPIANDVTAIHEDKKGTIWIGTATGLAKVVSRNPLRYKYYRHPTADLNKLLEDEIRTLYTDQEGSLWIGTTKGVCRLTEDVYGNFTFNSYPLYSTNLQGKSWINSLAEDRSGNILIATEQNGVKVLNKRSGRISSFSFINSEGRSIETVRAIQRNDDDLWIGTLGGLYIVNLTTARLHFYKNDPDDNLSLNDNSVRSIYSDQSGTHWIGTFYGGVNSYSPLSRQFGKIDLTDLKNQKIYKIGGPMATDKQGNLWISTDGSGLYCLNKEGKIIKQLRHHETNANSLSHNKIKCLLLENDGIWVGTIKGLNYYNFKNERIERYFYNDNDTNSLPDDRIYDLEKDSFGNIWIGTYRGGLCRLNPKTKTFLRFTHTSDSTTLSADGITYILEDSKEDLWVGTVSGLNKKNKNDDTFTRFESPTQNEIYVLCIYEDKKGRIWVGTRDTGLKLKIHGTNNFRTFSAEDGLAGNTVNGILEDSMGILWISTESGLSRLDPTNFKFDNYNKNDGLACSEFNFNSFHKNEDGQMYFGGYNGIVKFHPDSIRKNTIAPELTFTKLKLFNKEMPIDADGKGMLRKNIAKTENLTFDNTQNIFSIEFASLNFIHPGKNKYAYQLVGFEDEWNYVNDPVATYMNLSPGRYSLLVKGSNNDDVWNTKPIELKITVLPPWWRTWWAYAIYGCIIISIAYSLYRFKKMRWTLKHDLQIEHMEKEQQEQLHKAKLNFFTNIAHEIRTPLTLIVSPLDLATEHYPNEAFLQKQLQIVKSNTSRLMRLINQLLDFHKQESGNLKLRASAGNIVGLLKEIIFSFSDYAKSRQITLKFSSILDNVTMYYDRDGIEKVFCNLLNNAFKFTPAGGEVSIKVSTQVSNDNDQKASVKIIVADTGIGIPQSDLPKIFNRFFQAENARIGESGFGIGLALTKGIIELHGGTISVDSREAEMTQSGYTRFAISLPLELQQLSDNRQSAQGSIEETELFNESIFHMEGDLQDDQQSHRYSILLVEDNIEIRNCLKSILSFHYNILEASNGADALTLTNQELPDLVISDITMQGMDGLEFTKLVKSDERTNHIPIILLTARGSTDQLTEGISTGADDYIIKPFHNKVLELKIKNLLTIREKLREKYHRIVTLEPLHEEIEDPNNKFLQRLIGILETNINDAEFNVAKLVTEIGMSRPVLFRKVKMLTGLSVIDLIRSTRLKKAEMLLKQKRMSISEVAFTVGFNDPKHFSKSFRSQFGKNPSEYIDSLRD